MTRNLPDSLIQLKDDNIIDIIIYDSETECVILVTTGGLTYQKSTF